MSNFKRITQSAANVILAMLDGFDSFGSNHYKYCQKDANTIYINEYQNGRERGYTLTCCAPYRHETLKFKYDGNLTIIFYENRNSDDIVVKSFYGNNLWVNDYKNLPQDERENWGKSDKWFNGSQQYDATEYIKNLIEDFYTPVI